MLIIILLWCYLSGGIKIQTTSWLYLCVIAVSILTPCMVKCRSPAKMKVVVLPGPVPASLLSRSHKNGLTLVETAVDDDPDIDDVRSLLQLPHSTQQYLEQFTQQPSSGNAKSASSCPAEVQGTKPSGYHGGRIREDIPPPFMNQDELQQWHKDRQKKDNHNLSEYRVHRWLSARLQ